MNLRERVPLAPHCTLGVGGPARWFVDAADEATVLEALDWARSRSVPVRVLENTFLQRAPFAKAESVLANAFHMAGVPYMWRRGVREPLPEGVS